MCHWLSPNRWAPIASSSKSRFPLKPVDLTNAPYPCLAADTQVQPMVLLAKAEAARDFFEPVFENKIMHVTGTVREGANLTGEGRNAVAKSTDRLTSAGVMATELRASTRFPIVGPAAGGETACAAPSTATTCPPLRQSLYLLVIIWHSSTHRWLNQPDRTGLLRRS